MWKAVLVLIMTTSQSPVSMVLGVFPQQFITERACEEFVSEKKKEVGESADELAGIASSQMEDPDARLLGHEMSCVIDSSGEPV